MNSLVWCYASSGCASADGSGYAFVVVIWSSRMVIEICRNTARERTSGVDKVTRIFYVHKETVTSHDESEEKEIDDVVVETDGMEMAIHFFLDVKDMTGDNMAMEI